MEPVVHLRGTVALLGRFPALAGIDLDVLRGEIVLLRGPNGAGKTTLLRVLAGLVPPVRGEARVLGHSLPAEARAVRRRVGLLGHATALFEELTAADNVGFWGRACRASTDEIEAALGLVGLDGRLRDVAVSRLSAGQRRRTSLACLLARRPELWLLDEPHAGLDNDARDLLDGLVRQAVDQGATVVLSSHELDRAQALAHREVGLAGGITTPPTRIARDTAPGANGPDGLARGKAGPAPGVADRVGAAGPAAGRSEHETTPDGSDGVSEVPYVA
ncbi:MAG TPA: heme ABC exporter ATP-binding protein CcmA [Acidimicrobiales bacterium]|nr:heme ABC exporter ATP-binding protein CcmA [Acidimicrobiales bacterium]